MNTNVFILIAFMSVFVCGSHNLSLSFSNYDFEDSDVENQDTNIIEPMLSSLIVPGMGQYIKGDKKRAFFFFAIEGLALYYSDYYDNKADENVGDYKTYSNQYWGFDNWIINHEYWNDITSEYYTVFSKADGDYQMIWEDSHHVDFWIDRDSYPSNMSTSDDDFEDLYYDLIADHNNGIDFMSEYNIEFKRDHDFQEGIRKYNIFFAGWKDAVSNINIIYTDGGYTVASSPHKKEYNRIWNKSIDFYEYSEFAVTVLYLNHVISMLDVYFKDKFDNRFTIDAKNKYNYRLEVVDYLVNLSINF
ncbi:MAG: hypothetical protein CMG00_04540 [Candidatus Marinimicrobia bacterium]|nr:hypothetical protein [Candidatus Neomarinimicrobiota bacterium]